MKKQLLTIWLTSVVICASSQISVNYYIDNLPKPDGSSIIETMSDGDNFIIAGSFFDKIQTNPAVIKIDTLGNLVWSTSLYDTTEFLEDDIYQTAIDIEMGDDEFIYASFIIKFDDEVFDRWLYKIDKTTGNILWKSYLDIEDGLFSYFFTMDYDSTYVITAYYGPSSYIKMAFINRSTGIIEKTHAISGPDINDYLRHRHVAVDANKDIIYSKYDTIYKVSKYNLDSILWKEELYNYHELGSDQDVEYIHRIYIDSIGDIFVFGIQPGDVNFGFIAKVDPETGDQLWFTSTSDRVAVADFIDDGEYIYVSWQHHDIGGGIADIYNVKYRKSDGEIIWNNYYFMEGEPLDELCGNHAASLSIALDSDSMIYETGYFSSISWEPGNWGSLKLSAITGEVEYEVVVDNDYSTCDRYATGYGTFIRGNHIYYIGQLDNGDPSFIAGKSPYLIKTDKYTGAVLEKHPFGGIYQFDAYTADMIPYDSGMLVLKQIGKTSRVECYDAEKNLQWQKDISNDAFFFGNKLFVAQDNTIWMIGHSYLETDDEPYYVAGVDSIYVVRLDEMGNLLELSAKDAPSSSYYPIDLEVTGDTAFVLVNSGGYLHLLRYHDSNYYGDIALQYHSDEKYPFYFSVDLLVNDNIANKIDYWSFSSYYNGARLNRINKNTMVATIVDTLDVIDIVNHNLQINDSLVVVTGIYGYSGPASGDAVALYNLNATDTIWTFFDSKHGLYKSVIDTDKKFVYSAGASKTEYYLHKIDMLDGSLVWTTTYPILDADYSDYENFDIVYLPGSNLIVLACNYDTTTLAPPYDCKQPVIIYIDTAGTTLVNYPVFPEIPGIYRTYCAQPWSDGSIWAGGNSDIGGLRKAGFILLSDTLLPPPVIIDTTIVDSCAAFFEYVVDGTTATFTNLSVGSDSVPIVDYYWDFCDGSISVIENPVHVYDLPIICACLTITDSIGCADTYCISDDVAIMEHDKDILVFPNPAINNTIFIRAQMDVDIINIYDQTGVAINYAVTINDNKENVIQLQNKVSGILYVILETGGQQVVKKILIM